METLKVTVRNKTSVFLEAECVSISMVNKVGPLDILPEHANFISVVTGEIVAREMSGKIWKKEVVRGVARVVANVVDVVILEEVAPSQPARDDEVTSFALCA